MVKLAQGVTRYNMSKSAFNEAQILMPNSSLEQNAIADVLESMDNEIFVLEAKKAKYLSIKKGMMQELLTGKIRIV
jgi:type I restriction enzyme S subunit